MLSCNLIDCWNTVSGACKLRHSLTGQFLIVLYLDHKIKTGRWQLTHVVHHWGNNNWDALMQLGCSENMGNIVHAWNLYSCLTAQPGSKAQFVGRWLWYLSYLQSLSIFWAMAPGFTFSAQVEIVCFNYLGKENWTALPPLMHHPAHYVKTSLFCWDPSHYVTDY